MACFKKVAVAWVLIMMVGIVLGSGALYAENKININTAPTEVLETLPGVGPAIAERIVTYRAENPFTAIEDIKKVSGIGDATFEKIKDLISVK